MVEYLPVLQYKILELIITKSLEIDVEILIEDNGEVKFQKTENAEANLLEEDNDDDEVQFALDDCGPQVSNANVGNQAQHKKKINASRAIVTSSVSL